MIEALLFVTVVSLFVPVYVYLGYPLLLFILSRLWGRRNVDKEDIEPSVSFIVSCYNEKDVIEEKINNCLAIDYPKQNLEFIFVSDASNDGTDEIVNSFANDQIKLIRQEERLGKTMGLNLAVSNAKGEVIVFSDANAMYQPDALRKLVRNFNDPSIGYVVGAALYEDRKESSAAASEDAYWQYEIAIKSMESSLHSVVGGDGAIYAIRKRLYKALDRDDISDFVNPLQIIAAGYRGVFDDDAICFEQTAGNFDKEAARKRRIVNRSFNGLLKNKELLNPFKFGIYSWALISHKLLRWLVPFFLIFAAVGVLILAMSEVMLFQIGLMLGVVFVWAVMLGYILRRQENLPGLLLYPYYFYLVNINSMIGVLQCLRGEVQIVWNTPREKSQDQDGYRAIPLLIWLIFLLVTIAIFFVTANSVTKFSG